MKFSDNWWDDLIYEYDEEGLTMTVVELKRQRHEQLPLRIESYDFIIFLAQGAV